MICLICVRNIPGPLSVCPFGRSAGRCSGTSSSGVDLRCTRSAPAAHVTVVSLVLLGSHCDVLVARLVLACGRRKSRHARCIFFSSAPTFDNPGGTVKVK